MKIWAAVLAISSLAIWGQAPPAAGTPNQPGPNQGEQNRSVLDVQPGTPAIKNKDLYEKSGYWHPFRRMAQFVAVDQKKIWTSPFHTSRKDAKYWAIFGAATAGLIAADPHIARDAPDTPGLRTLGKDVSYLGDPYTLIPIAAGFYFIGSARHNERFRETGLISFETLVDVTVVELVVKSITDRQRPLEGDGGGHFEESTSPRWNSGFPSGHAIETFALASIFAHEYHNKLWVKLLAYSYAGGVVGARLAANRHFPGDVLAGGAMGWFIGDYVYAKRHNPALDPDRMPNQTSMLERIMSHVHVGGPEQARQLDDPDAVRTSALARQPPR